MGAILNGIHVWNNSLPTGTNMINRTSPFFQLLSNSSASAIVAPKITEFVSAYTKNSMVLTGDILLDNKLSLCKNGLSIKITKWLWLAKTYVSTRTCSINSSGNSTCPGDGDTYHFSNYGSIEIPFSSLISGEEILLTSLRDTTTPGSSLGNTQFYVKYIENNNSIHFYAKDQNLPKVDGTVFDMNWSDYTGALVIDSITSY